ncbi:sigma-70 family RNA polymerase sigma factor [Acidiferrimicrobium sp. IK]|uniref:sigma-70 family RNA polymerase sigma factor n=1 Tax=Acidiferrimicrobium sp. IK TaxID=2871700 RepID=UPI0021CAFE44|nr:sigma-70 family RNA polymerase sigma factor [Acidiferrimicrobium sp. IK]MCU4183111.1 sigma-70 family RNA polymerase sigma factor [Acidiferrimicrobium sp. IK]
MISSRHPRSMPPAHLRSGQQLSAEETSLVESHLTLARAMARRYVNRGAEFDDLEQVAMLALIGAARRFDPSRGAAFSTYAITCIVGELKRHFRDHLWGLRVPRSAQETALAATRAVDELHQSLGRSPSLQEIADHLGVGEERVLEAMETVHNTSLVRLDAPSDNDGTALIDETAADPRSQPEAVLDRVALEGYLPGLGERDRRILGLVYLEGCTQAEVGRRIGLSQMQVSRVLKGLLERMRAELAMAE